MSYRDLIVIGPNGNLVGNRSNYERPTPQWWTTVEGVLVYAQTKAAFDIPEDPGNNEALQQLLDEVARTLLRSPRFIHPGSSSFYGNGRMGFSGVVEVADPDTARDIMALAMEEVFAEAAPYLTLHDPTFSAKPLQS